MHAPPFAAAHAPSSLAYTHYWVVVIESTFEMSLWHMRRLQGRPLCAQFVPHPSMLVALEALAAGTSSVARPAIRRAHRHGAWPLPLEL